MSDGLTDLVAKKFIARRDVKAVQHKGGAWSPHQKFNPETHKHDGPRIPWCRADLDAHISGEHTFGHYLLNTDNTCKLFAFDIDLEKSGVLPTSSEMIEESFEPCDDLRAAWLDRKNVGRSWMKLQFKEMAHMLMRGIHEELDLQCAAAYSGGKGIHVYGFTGVLPADEVREGAQIVLDSLNCFEVVRGQHFFKHVNEHPWNGYPNLSIEVFPKQGSLDGKDLGNLMRLPLGRNLKSTDPTFFIDMRSALGQMIPQDPIEALTLPNPWSDN